MDQPTFADLEYDGKKRKTRREMFLERMDSLIPWDQLEERIRPFYPKAGRGRRPYELSAMLRIHCVQLFYNLSDPGMEDMLYEVAQTNPRRPAGEVMRHHLDRQPGAVGGETPRRHVVQPDAVLEVAYGVVDLGVAAMIGLQFQGLPIAVGDEAVIAVGETVRRSEAVGPATGRDDDPELPSSVGRARVGSGSVRGDQPSSGVPRTAASRGNDRGREHHRGAVVVAEESFR